VDGLPRTLGASSSVGAVPLFATGMGETAAAAPARPSCLKRPRRDRAGRAWQSSVFFGIVPSPAICPRTGLIGSKIVITAGYRQSTLAKLQDQHPNPLSGCRSAASGHPTPHSEGPMPIPLSRAPRPG
jgi:hypothetical protein